MVKNSKNKHRDPRNEIHPSIIQSNKNIFSVAEIFRVKINQNLDIPRKNIAEKYKS